MLRALSKTESRWRNQGRAREGGCVFPPSGRWSARRRGGVSTRAPLARRGRGCGGGPRGWGSRALPPWRGRMEPRRSRAVALSRQGPGLTLRVAVGSALTSPDLRCKRVRWIAHHPWLAMAERVHGYVKAVCSSDLVEVVGSCDLLSSLSCRRKAESR